MSKAEEAIKLAPGVLAVKVDFEKQQATIGTKSGSVVSMNEVFAALKSIGYSGDIVETRPRE